jgi:hypothetical protein
VNCNFYSVQVDLSKRPFFKILSPRIQNCWFYHLWYEIVDFVTYKRKFPGPKLGVFWDFWGVWDYHWGLDSNFLSQISSPKIAGPTNERQHCIHPRIFVIRVADSQTDPDTTHESGSFIFVSYHHSSVFSTRTRSRWTNLNAESIVTSDREFQHLLHNAQLSSSIL